ncbi:hypothetical protein CGLO_01742 [Colletotrichum gloeosporioides Cg-14]|uniref:Uncharacterized protein n=1 Tax=Colletotrichum gloeosporioides (strain Cg-14) TaxID=1237896 RepID=T0KZT4_COLGC|nr:hypothetical protein CGLO_01742 [Colletotrichum gloeosporioides Cg-14]
MAGSDSRQLAKELVQEIATKYGYLEEETLRHVTNLEARRKIENAIRSLSAQSGLSIITLAKNLYSSKTRFIFELLQNADDNQYNKASASGSIPFVSFHIFPDQIIIECNEDGFTHENMKAICAVGESSKTGAQGYIGEKGIGFKSVFMVAWKVHIQSNAFSFSFRHQKGESGMGMITPVWEETDEVLESPLTVITLHLLNTETSNGVAETGEMIRAQFDELQETVLLFLKNIRRISVSFYDDDERQTTTVSHARTQPQPGRVELESVYATNGRRRKQTKHFHVTRVKATNLAKNDNRTYTEAEEAVRAYSASEVVVAFPLSKKSVPIVEPQDVFAFLPVRPAGFNFVIQADFVTNANRQDILKDSRRNIGLLHAVGEAFVTAATEFQTHETLRYQWVQFLPDRNSSWDGFWLGLVKKIAVLLRSKPVLYDHKSLAPRTVDELLRLLPDCADEHGNPLFDDGNPAQVISRRYSQAELRLLGGYGLRDVDHSRVIGWLRADLRNTKSSRMKSPDTPESWHERAAKFLNAAFVKKMHQITAILVNLDLIPLADGTWASTSSGSIYFAQADGLNVPTDVGLRVVSRRVTEHQRLLLFKSLGVTTAEIQLVRGQILQSYKRGPRPEFTIDTSKDHLKFLYMTENQALRNGSYESIAIFNHRDECVWTAPLDMRTKFALERLYQPWFRTNGTNNNSTYLNLFRSMIGIEDCTWAIFIDELRELKASKCDDTDRIGTIYKALNALCRDPLVIQDDQSKSIFEDEALIYLPVDSGLSWHRPSECVWSNATRLSGRVSLNEEFEDLEVFFVEFLGVKPLDLSMAIDDLKNMATRASATSSEIKDLIWAVNSLLPTVQKPPSSRDVLKTKVFPIAYPNGRVTVGTATTGFCIIDRESLRFSFRNKVNFLDFTLEQVARLRPFLEWTHLEDRYLSCCVKEITSFHGGPATPIMNPQRQIRNRAHALLRVAAHFESPRSQNSRDMDSLYAVLRSARIYETDGISSDLCLVQGETSFEVEGEKSSLHIDETQSGLKIYVPRDKDHQEYMFTNLLPDKLLDCMMRHPVTQVSQNVTNSAMNATKNIVLAPVGMLDRALEDNGIAEVQVANVDEVVALDTASSATAVSVADTTTDNNANDRGGSEAGDAEIRMAFASSSSTNQRAVVNSTVHRSMSAQSSAWSSNTPSQSSWTPSSGGSRNDASGQAPYTALLSKVIAAGQRPRANVLPLCGAFDLSQLYTDLQPTRDDAELGLRSTTQIERDCKIGAAGELYVFELLSHLSDQNVPLPPLPEFSRDNWQSNIRRYVTVHPDYALMEPWSGRETSDIVYEDVSKQLTSLLVRQGYLETRWLSRPRGPKYFIEVKTTTMSCETAFYMSKAQYQRMRNNLVTDDSDTMYVIFRVYNLGQKDIGLKVYVDPETLRLAGRLKFTGETWSVVPG